MDKFRPPVSKAQQTEKTVSLLLAAARKLFSEKGFSDTSTEEIVRAAQVTRGALYYHFSNKEAVFAAVFNELQREIESKIETATKDISDPWDAFMTGSRCFLEACLDPAIRRIVILEAPSVLGVQAWREADARHSMRQLREAVEDMLAEKTLKSLDAGALTAMLNGSLNDAALWISGSANPNAALLKVYEGFELMTIGLRNRETVPEAAHAR